MVGRRMKGVPEDRVLDHLAGFACANDVGLHDFRHADRGSMLRVKGQDGFLPLGPQLVPAGEWDPSSYTLRTYLNGAVVQEATAGDLIWPVTYQLADLCRLITLEPGDVVLTGTPANSRPMRPGDVVEVEVSGLGRLDEHGGRVGRRPLRPRRAAGGLRGHAARRARDPRGRGGASRPGGEDRAVIRLSRIDHVCLRVAELAEAAPRWALQLGLAERSREGGRALLACNDEPYCLELVEGGAPGHDHTGFELAPGCSLDDARAHLESHGVGWEERDGGLYVRDPDGRGIELMPHRPAASEVERWPQHARPSRTVHLGGPRKLGHVNCLTADIEEGVRFYTEVLGMRVSDWLGDGGVWFHVNSDHHVMALVDKGYAHFHHLAFETVDIGKQRDLLDHLARHGRWLGWGPTRHGIAGNIASYVRIVEEECFVELYCDMEQLQDGHVPRVYPDDRYSSNTWGPLPPRSYFRFDAAAIESERQSLETLGIPLPPA